MYGLGRTSGERQSTGHRMYSKDQQDVFQGKQLGPQRKAGVWESTRCLGKMQLLQPGPACTCPKREGSRRISQNAKQPASGQPQPEGKEV